MIKFLFLFLPVMALLFVSCAGRADGVLLADGGADLRVQVSLEPGITALIGRLAALSGTAGNASALDGDSVTAAMSAAPGVASAALKNKTPSAIEGPIKISQLNDFLAGGAAKGFFTFDNGGGSGTGRFAAELDLASGPEMLAFLSPEVSAYLGALMAPLATGEKMTRTEYLTLAGSVYGKGIAEEIARAEIQAAVDFPGPVQSVKGGSFSGVRANFVIPLLDLLVLEQPLRYETVWKQGRID